MTNLQLETEQKQVLETEISPILETAKSMVVKNQEQRSFAASFIAQLKDLKENIETRFHPTANKKKAYEVYESLLATERAFYNPIAEAEAIAKKSVRDFDTSETLRIQREQREAQEKEEQKEREEKAKREAEAKAEQEAEEKRQLEEFERLEEEKRKKIALQQSATESGNAKVAGIAAKEVAKIESEIQKVSEEGEKKLDEIKQKAEEAPALKMAFKPAPMPVKKLVWKARITNMMKVCRAIGSGDVPFNVVEVRQSALNDFAKDYDGKTKIEGLEFYQESTGRI